jgi:hypothetical protein
MAFVLNTTIMRSTSFELADCLKKYKRWCCNYDFEYDVRTLCKYVDMCT